MINSKDLEKKVLSGLLQNQDQWGEISAILTDEDFYSAHTKVHVSIFRMLKAALNNAEEIDETILVERIKQLGVTFPDDIDVSDYIYSLSFQKSTPEIFLVSVKELKKVTVRRKVYNTTHEMQKYVKSVDPNVPYEQIIEHLDGMHNETIRTFESSGSKVIDLAKMCEELVEDRGNNPPEEVGFMSHYPTLNKIFGSIFRAGNMTCFAARAKAGKSSIAIDLLLEASYRYKVPVLHFDNGEMSAEELVFRMVSNMSGIPMHLLESGEWRHASYEDWSSKEVVERVRSVWERVKGIKIMYENVSGLSPEEMIGLLKRLYYSEVGRGNPLVFSFDYIKSDFASLGKGSEWAYVGKMLDAFKQAITKSLVFDGKPVVSMLTSLQQNRIGIVSNKSSDTVVDDESTLSLSDNVIQFVSHLFILRAKTLDELGDHGDKFGTHKLICLAARHLGKEPFAHLYPIDMPDGTMQKNFINLRFNNFRVTDCGDLRDINKAKAAGVAMNGDEDSGLPAGL